MGRVLVPVGGRAVCRQDEHSPHGILEKYGLDHLVLGIPGTVVTAYRKIRREITHGEEIRYRHRTGGRHPTIHCRHGNLGTAGLEGRHLAVGIDRSDFRRVGCPADRSIRGLGRQDRRRQLQSFSDLDFSSLPVQGHIRH